MKPFDAILLNKAIKGGGGGGGNAPINPTENATIVPQQSFTTSFQKGAYVAFISGENVAPDEITVVFDNATYNCNRYGNAEYGAPFDEELGTYDFSTYPFCLINMGDDGWVVLTETESSHVISATGIMQIEYVVIKALQNIPALSIQTGEIMLVKEEVANPYILNGAAEIYGSPDSLTDAIITFDENYEPSINKTYANLYALLTSGSYSTGYVKTKMIGYDQNDPTLQSIFYLDTSVDWDDADNRIILRTPALFKGSNTAYVFYLDSNDDLTYETSMYIVPAGTLNSRTSIYPFEVTQYRNAILLPRLKPVTINNNAGYKISLMGSMDQAGNDPGLVYIENNASATIYMPIYPNGRINGGFIFRWQTVPTSLLTLTASSNDGTVGLQSVASPNDQTGRNPYRSVFFVATSTADSATITISQA